MLRRCARNPALATAPSPPTEGVAEHIELAHAIWEKLEADCACPIWICIRPLKNLDFPIGIARHAFPCADLSEIVSIAAYTIDFIEPEYEKLHKGLLGKRRAVEPANTIVSTFNEGSREHFE